MAARTPAPAPTMDARMASVEANISLLVASVDALVSALTSAPAAAAPARGKTKSTAKSPFVPAPKGHKMAATREANLAGAVAHKHCPACEIGFAFAKTVCPRCGDAI